MKLYKLPLTGSDGKTYDLRIYQTMEEMEQLQRVGIVDAIWEKVSIEPVSEVVMRAMGAFAKDRS